MALNKKKCRQYSIEYLAFGFIASPTNAQLPMCLLCERVFSNEAMKPSRLKKHLAKIHPEKANKDSAFFETLREKHDRSKELKASPVEQRHMEGSVLPMSHPPLHDSPKTTRLLPTTSSTSSSNPMAPTSPSTSHPDSSSDLCPPYPFRSSSSIPTHSSSFPDFPSPSSSPPSSVRCPAPSHTSLLPSSSSPLRPTQGGHRSQPRLRVEVLEQLSRCASISLEEQQQSRVVLGKTTRSLGTLAASMQDLVESQREFAHDSLKMQREMLDTLRQFSTSALTLLRNKVDGHPPL